MSQQPFSQNIIAVIWDYDKTLIPGNMQKPLFEAYGVEEKKFWKEVDAEIEKHRANGDRVSPEMLYLNHILAYVQKGTFDSLNNAKLREFGKQIEFYPGLPDFFRELKASVENEQAYKDYDIRLEHYVASTGLRKIIEGSAIAEYLTGVWGCEFLEEPCDGKMLLSKIAYVLDHTTKTRVIFEINKGVNFDSSIELNARMEESLRRVPISQMIYVGDGPSDVPVFSVVNRYRGTNLAVYDPEYEASYNQVHDLLMQEKRVHHFGPADFTPNAPVYLWLMRTVRSIAEQIVQRRKQALNESVGIAPKHV